MLYTNANKVLTLLLIFGIPLATCTLYQAATVKINRTSLTHNILHKINDKHRCAAFCDLQNRQGKKCNSFYINMNKSECHLQYLDKSEIHMLLSSGNNSEENIWINIKKPKSHNKKGCHVEYLDGLLTSETNTRTSTNLEISNSKGKLKRCPSSYPYAYRYGERCCHYPHEENDDDYADCTGKPLTINSTCCFLGWSISCDEQENNSRCIDAEEALASCPWSHPHPYNYYRSCCAHPYEGEGLFPPDHDYYKFCDKSPLGHKSLCCQGNDTIDCPHFNKDDEDEYGLASKGSRCVAPSRVPWQLDDLSEKKVWINLDNLESNTNLKRCPSSYPYAYKNGEYCCYYPHEGNTDDPSYKHCNGKPLTINSDCCLLNRSDKYVRCDEEDHDARCIDAPRAVCPWSHPYPFNWFKDCCAHSTEGYLDPDHAYYHLCSGNPISYKSLCCKDNENIDCPHYDKENRVGSRCAAPTRIQTLTVP